MTSQPIALPKQHNDYPMHDPGSYSSDGTFNPASFTRRFLGSPISWRAAASFSAAPIIKSPDSDVMNFFDREGEYCRNYTCCGMHLRDLHALLEHFEQVHIVVLDPTSSQPHAHIQIPFNPTIHDTPFAPQQHQHYPFDPDDMELDIDLDHPTRLSHSSPSSGAPSPPDTPISTPLSAYPSPYQHHPRNQSPYFSRPPSPLSSTAASTRQNSPTRHIASAGFPRATPTPQNLLAHPEEVFNPYARFASDYSSCMPGAQFNAATVDEASAIQNTQPWQHQQQQQPGVPPALLFGTSSSSSATTTTTSPLSPSASRVPSPTNPPSALTKSHPNLQQPPSSSAAPLPRPQPSLLLSKPFRCPKPNCNKSYKQANGLKYHMTHGSCNFAPPKDLEHVKDLLERKRREREMKAEGSSAGLTRSASLGSVPSPSGSSSIPIPVSATEPPTPTGGHPLSPTSILSLTYSDLSNISEHDLREVEKEAERRLRPFACGVGDCQRRYKNMNGLRYHYQHSGDHGAVGLALLASGQHECLGAGKRAQQQQHQHGNSSGGGSNQRGKGSASVPVSRAGSVSVASSRVGTPQPAGVHVKQESLGSNVTVGSNSGPGSATGTTTTTTVITPTPVQVFTNGSGSPQQQQQQQQLVYYQQQQQAVQQQQAAQQQQQQQVHMAAAYHHYAQQMQIQRQYQALHAAAQAQAAASAQVQGSASQQQQSTSSQPQSQPLPQQQQQQYTYADYPNPLLDAYTTSPPSNLSMNLTTSPPPQTSASTAGNGNSMRSPHPSPPSSTTATAFFNAGGEYTIGGGREDGGVLVDGW